MQQVRAPTVVLVFVFDPTAVVDSFAAPAPAPAPAVTHSINSSVANQGTAENVVNQLPLSHLGIGKDHSKKARSREEAHTEPMGISKAFEKTATNRANIVKRALRQEPTAQCATVIVSISSFLHKER